MFSCGLLLKVPAFMRIKHLDLLWEVISIQTSHTALLCLLTIKECMWWFWHLSKTWSHVSGSVEVHMGHVMDGNLSISKKSCFWAFFIY